MLISRNTTDSLPLQNTLTLIDGSATLENRHENGKTNKPYTLQSQQASQFYLNQISTPSWTNPRLASTCQDSLSGVASAHQAEYFKILSAGAL